MPFVCYIYVEDRDVPHMEVLGEDSLTAARERARRLLLDRPMSSSAEIYEDDVLRERIGR